MNKKILQYIDKFINDKDGKTVIIQSPNLPIVGWLIFMLAAYFFPDGLIKTGLISISNSFLFLWAYLEITDGVNYFRRFLGLIVIIVLTISFFVI